jgi:glycosyltransferase involved in cell wall biosynthesis
MARRPVVRKWLGKKIDGVMRHATIVWAGNSYLGNWATKAGAKRVVILPTVIDPERYSIKEYTSSYPVVVGWIGSPTTLKYLNEIRPVLEKLSKELDVVIHVVGGNRGWRFDGSLKLIQWTEEGEVSAIQGMDIGVMPLPDDPWEKGKCAYKLIQYMACGLPVVASPVGMNVDVVVHGENGFLAKTQEEWYGYLKMLILDGEMRREMGGKGFALVKEHYTIERNFEVIKRELSGK